MTIRALLHLALLSSVLVVSACGNKGPLLPPPAPEDDEWPAGAEAGSVDDSGETLDGLPIDDEADAYRDADSDIDPVLDPEVEAGVDGEGDDPAPGTAGDDGDGGA